MSNNYCANILFSNGEVIKANCNLEKTILGELVFNTSMTGYQEIMTDPSYKEQVVVMTYPLIGNYGVDSNFIESDNISINALIVKENPSINKDFFNYLTKNNILCLYDIDTRMLTKKIRTLGAKNCLITTQKINDTHKKMLKKYTFPTDTIKQVYYKKQNITGKGKNIALVDLGVKNSIVKNLVNANCSVKFFPYNANANEILNGNFDGVLFSNGPGDPKDAVEAIKCAKELIGKIPIYGICLGHQILAIALGGLTYKLKFGHRGGNHPVMNLIDNKVIMTSQNHGYAVDSNSLPKECKISYINLNDNTIEGFISEKYNIKTVQFHPEAGPGPLDAGIIFSEWFN